MVNREGEPGQQWDENAAFPRRLVMMGSNDSLNNCVSNAIFDLHFVHGGSNGDIEMSYLAEAQYGRTHEVMKNWFSM